MKFLKTFESYNGDTLIIIDVQRSFKKYFSEMYLNELKKYCSNFQNVYQLWDNHIDGKNVDKDYLYDETPVIPIHKDLYHFPNQKELIEKRYNYNVDADFYKKILDKEVELLNSDLLNKKITKRQWESKTAKLNDQKKTVLTEVTSLNSRVDEIDLNQKQKLELVLYLLKMEVHCKKWQNLFVSA